MKGTKQFKAKICLVGEGAVGKTSLIRRFVLDQFKDDYIMTLGAKVMKKVVEVPLSTEGRGARVELLIWDVMGQPKFRELLEDVYFQGTLGILAVADLTRRETLDALFEWIDRVDRVTNHAPVLLVVNKADLARDARIGEIDIARFARAFRAEFLMTSAKTGANVEEAFRRLGVLVAKHQLWAG
jgi:small GTP-binding protein